jgi:diketogulonate reductase-like aldo/keto reductase
MRFVLQKGAVIAAGTGSNATTAPAYSAENLDVFGFELSASEMATLGSFNNATTTTPRSLK